MLSDCPMQLSDVVVAHKQHKYVRYLAAFIVLVIQHSYGTDLKVLRAGSHTLSYLGFPDAPIENVITQATEIVSAVFLQPLTHSQRMLKELITKPSCGVHVGKERSTRIGHGLVWLDKRH